MTTTLTITAEKITRDPGALRRDLIDSTMHNFKAKPYQCTVVEVRDTGISITAQKIQEAQ